MPRRGDNIRKRKDGRWDDIKLESKVITVRQTVSRIWRFEDGKKTSVLTVGPPKSQAYGCKIPFRDIGPRKCVYYLKHLCAFLHGIKAIAIRKIDFLTICGHIGVKRAKNPVDIQPGSLCCV